MRYSKLLFVLMLTLILVFGSSMSAFAEESLIMPPPPTPSEPDLYLSVTPEGGGVASGDVITIPGFPFNTYKAWINAEPSDNYYFVEWKELVFDFPVSHWDYFSSEPYVENISMLIFNPFIHSRTFKAFFEEKPDLTITVNDPLMGTYSGSTEGKYNPGDPISIIPEPEDGYRLDYWMMGPNMHNPWEPISFNMPNDDVSIQLYFEEIPWYNITTDVMMFESWGTVTGEGRYQVGDDVTLVATPARGYAFDHWEWNWYCDDNYKVSEVPLMPPPKPIIDPEDPSITFPMKECDGHFTAYFHELEGPFGVKLEAIRVGDGPDIVGHPELVGDPLPGDSEFDGYFYETEQFTVDPEPIEHWHFVGYDWEKIYDEPEIARLTVIESLYDSEDPDRIFTMHSWNKLIKVYYEEDDYVMATIEYHNTVGGELRPDDTVKVYLDEPYSFSPPAISGYQHIYSTPNASGTLTEGATDFVVTFVYQVPPTPQVITNTVTETVIVTQTVTVPATTAPTTEAVIPEEETPLGAAMIGFNFDEILEPVPVVEETPEELLPVEETPLGDALPQTGQLPADLFYGIGGLVSAMGVYLKRRK